MINGEYQFKGKDIHWQQKMHENNPTPNNTVFPAFSVCIVYIYSDGLWPVVLCVCMNVWMATVVCSYISVQMVDSQTPKVLFNLHIRSPGMLYIWSYCYCVCYYRIILTSPDSNRKPMLFKNKIKENFYPCCCI